MSRPTDLCVRLSDFVAWRKLVTGMWYANPVTGDVFKTRDGSKVAFRADKWGYLCTNTRYFSLRVRIPKHRFIWIAAHGIPPHDFSMTIDHINGDKSDNRIENLQMITQDENNWKGTRKLTMDQAREIRRRYAEGDATYEKLAAEYKTSATLIAKIIRNDTYREVTNDDNEE